MAPVVVQIREELSGKIRVHAEQTPDRRGAFRLAYRLQPLGPGEVRQMPLVVELQEDRMVLLATEETLGGLKLVTPDRIEQRVPLADLTQPLFKGVFQSYVQSVLTPLATRTFVDS